jgi:hypothetical protein
MFYNETMGLIAANRISNKKISKTELFDSIVKSLSKGDKKTNVYISEDDLFVTEKNKIKKSNKMYSEEQEQMFLEKAEKAFELAQDEWFENAEQAFGMARQEWEEEAEAVFEMAKEDFIAKGEKILKQARKDWEKERGRK